MFKNMESIVQTAYGCKAAQEYDNRRFTTEQGRLFSKLEFDELERAVAGIPRGADVLEVGCGTARFSEYLARQGYRVVASDPSLDMIRVASEKCAGLDNISFRQEQGASLLADDSTFDFVFAIRVTNQTESVEYALKMIREMIRVTKPGGAILVEFVNSRRPFRKNSVNVRLSFAQIARIVFENNCTVKSRRGVFVFSQTLLNKVPEALIPFWALIEQFSAVFFWRWASRGYILLRKR